VYPVTQLWNSLLGLVVLPREVENNRLSRIAMADLLGAGWPDIETGGDRAKTLGAFVRALRNAVAHFNVEFQADDNEIRRVTVWNNPMNRGVVDRSVRSWEATIPVESLDSLARLIAEEYIRSFKTAAA